MGSTQDTVFKFLGRKVESTVEITIWDRPSTFGFKVIKGPLPFQGVMGLEPSGDNATELTIDFEGEMPGDFFKLAEGLVAKQLEKQFDTDFNALKLLLESEQD